MPSASRLNPTVLIVDNDQLSRELLTHVLQTGGFNVIATPTGERALLVMCECGEQIDWLVTKVKLPGLVCGWILTDEHRELHPDRPTLLLADLPGPPETSSAQVVFVPPTAPIRVLDLLKALVKPQPAQVLSFVRSEAADHPGIRANA